MSNIKNAAIILLGMGENCASQILKNLDYKEVEAIIEIMNEMEDISEEELIKALNSFFKETNLTTGITVSSGEYIRKSLVSAVGSEKAETIFDETQLGDKLKGCELLKWQPIYNIVNALEEEHPQIIAVALTYLDSEKSAQVLQLLPKEVSNDVIKRITNVSPVSSNAMQILSECLEEQFTQHEKFKPITSNGIHIAANIISKMDVKAETEVMSYLSIEDQLLSEKIQERLFPFERLSQLDRRGIQTLIAEVNNDLMIQALNGSPETIKEIFFKNMSAKSVELLKDDMDSAGASNIVSRNEAQKNIVEIAKRLLSEQKIAFMGDN